MDRTVSRSLLPSRSGREQAVIESHELAHRNRQTVLSKLRRLRQEGPARAPEALNTEQVVAALRRFQAARSRPDRTVRRWLSDLRSR
jgi:hypothetical protein